MATQWDAWLAGLKAAGLLAENIPPATRGLKWEQPVEVEGDWTGAALEGSVRATPDSASVLATFSITGPIVAGGWSTWTASLAAGSGANSTGVLPADGDADGVTELPCMFRLTPSGDDKDTLFGGTFTVLGIV